MTRNGNLKRLVRARAAKTGESYTAALSRIRQLTSRPRPRPRRSMLRIASRSWLKRELVVSGEEGAVLFTASWRPGFPTGIWTVHRNSEPFAVLRCKAFSALHKCVVKMDGETFVLQNRLALSRITEVRGGRFDGATLSGNLLDLKFRIDHGGRLVAEAEGKILSTHQAHVVHIRTADDPDAEQLAALMMIAPQLRWRRDSTPILPRLAPGAIVVVAVLAASFILTPDIGLLSGAAFAIISGVTMKPAKAWRRASASASCPMDVHTSV